MERSPESYVDIRFGFAIHRQCDDLSCKLAFLVFSNVL